MSERISAARGVFIALAVLIGAWFLTPRQFIVGRENRLRGLIGSYGANPSAHIMYPYLHAPLTPGGTVFLSAMVDMPGAPAHWVSATFYVDGQAITGSTTDGYSSISATWDPAGVANPSEHNVYVVATVADTTGDQYTVDSRANSPQGDGRAILFAIASVSLVRAEFTDAQPMWYTEHDYGSWGGSGGQEFLVPTDSVDPDSRPHWQLLTDTYGPYERGPYVVGKALNQSASLALGTNITGTPGMPTSIKLDGTLVNYDAGAAAVWPDGWHTSVSVGSSGATATTPAFSDWVEIDTLSLASNVVISFSDGYDQPISTRNLSFEVMMNIGDRDADPVPDPSDEDVYSFPSAVAQAETGGSVAAAPRRQLQVLSRPGTDRVASSPSAAGKNDLLSFPFEPTLRSGLLLASGPGGASIKPAAFNPTLRRIATQWTGGRVLAKPTAFDETLLGIRLCRTIYGGGLHSPDEAIDPEDSRIIYDPGVLTGDAWTLQVRRKADGTILKRENFYIGSFLAKIGTRPGVQCTDVSSMVCVLMQELGVRNMKVLFIPGKSSSQAMRLYCNTAYYTGFSPPASMAIIDSGRHEHPDHWFAFHQTATNGSKVFEAAFTFGGVPAWPPAGLSLPAYKSGLGCTDTSHDGYTNRFTSSQYKELQISVTRVRGSRGSAPDHLVE